MRISEGPSDAGDASIADVAGHPPVIVFGECLVDRFEQATIPGGAPFNVARHLAAFGLNPLFITRIGADADGDLLRAALAACGVRGDGVQVDPLRPSGQVLVHTRADGHDFEILPDQAYDAMAPAELPPEMLSRPAWLYFGTLAQRSAQNRAALDDLRAGVAHQAFVDLNWRAGQVPPARALAMLDCADTLKLSADELGLLLSWRKLVSPHSARVPAAGARCAGVAALLAGRRVSRLIVTHGADGYAHWTADGSCEHAGAGLCVGAVMDTVGAGDAFSAITLAGLLLGWPMDRTLARANAFAASICTVRGAAPAQRDFYVSWARRWRLPT
jgi:fructokinase